MYIFTLCVAWFDYLTVFVFDYAWQTYSQTVGTWLIAKVIPDQSSLSSQHI